eukprot:2990001-Prymnesium_polylepis.4
MPASAPPTCARAMGAARIFTGGAKRSHGTPVEGSSTNTGKFGALTMQTSMKASSCSGPVSVVQQTTSISSHNPMVDAHRRRHEATCDREMNVAKETAAATAPTRTSATTMPSSASENSRKT